ncbi:TetR/AcrR family transcriptional regulator [Nocardia cyriacigeorgica]|uniref:Helix-turn-helix transcriptional regulator n=1 Tax=Nocardia cyriacigeorgica TaxID=135487 RepID=A0A5R8NM62_9NOCA|nr:TetR/AcrR family transcriptional regulator [Nocardia cyriacigeorgica]TLF76780.1 helix-turn-helix transcriptional regulator [Nocardia cyriacigeorgica]
MPSQRRVNRGPAAAARNRAAILAAARTVLAEDGIDASLAKIARTAEVGSGSLYRHFPTRESLAMAVFADQIHELEELGARSESTLDDVLDLVIAQLPVSAALISSLTPAPTLSATDPDPGLSAIGDRLSALLAAKLATPETRGTIHPDTTAEQLFLAIAMVAALLTTTAPALRPAVAVQCREILLRGLRYRSVGDTPTS